MVELEYGVASIFLSTLRHIHGLTHGGMGCIPHWYYRRLLLLLHCIWIIIHKLGVLFPLGKEGQSITKA